MHSCIMDFVGDSAQFAATVKRRRKQLGLTQEDVAFSAGVNRRVVSELESGARQPLLKNALAVAAALGLEVALLPRSEARTQR